MRWNSSPLRITSTEFREQEVYRKIDEHGTLVEVWNRNGNYNVNLPRLSERVRDFYNAIKQRDPQKFSEIKQFGAGMAEDVDLRLTANERENLIVGIQAGSSLISTYFASLGGHDIYRTGLVVSASSVAGISILLRLILGKKTLVLKNVDKQVGNGYKTRVNIASLPYVYKTLYQHTK